REAASQLSPAEEVVGLPSASEDCWLILADRQGVGEALAGLLDTRGVPHVLVSHGTQYQQLDDQRFVIQPADGEDLQRVWQALRADGQRVGR
ncbi:MAG: hypothetical protein GTO03_05290, partial [Planctomycetales bacterium]|nr:hypothetical protein [Planctomycetales bacterium]